MILRITLFALAIHQFNQFEVESDFCSHYICMLHAYLMRVCVCDYACVCVVKVFEAWKNSSTAGNLPLCRHMNSAYNSRVNEILV